MAGEDAAGEDTAREAASRAWREAASSVITQVEGPLMQGYHQPSQRRRLQGRGAVDRLGVHSPGH